MTWAHVAFRHKSSSAALSCPDIVLWQLNNNAAWNDIVTSSVVCEKEHSQTHWKEKCQREVLDDGSHNGTAKNINTKRLNSINDEQSLKLSHIICAHTGTIGYPLHLCRQLKTIPLLMRKCQTNTSPDQHVSPCSRLVKSKWFFVLTNM